MWSCEVTSLYCKIMTLLSHSNCSTIYNGKQLALLIKVVREVVFTLGKWSFSKQLGKLPFTTVRAATKGLGSKTNGWIHSILVTEGQQKVHLPNLLQGSLQDLIKNYNSPVCADPENTGSLPGREVKHWAETVETLWHLLKKTCVACDNHYKFGTMWMTSLNFQFSCTE